jgi:hypothetical protein
VSWSVIVLLHVKYQTFPIYQDSDRAAAQEIIGLMQQRFDDVFDSHDDTDLDPHEPVMSHLEAGINRIRQEMVMPFC